MSEANNIVRVVLRSNGSVHIAFEDTRSICATAENILELFSDPIGFIEEKSHSYQDSTFDINRNRVSLDAVLGLTLAAVNSDKQIICDFPELFKHIASIPDEEKSKPLNMNFFQYETDLSDEKSFLLRYFLEYTNDLTSSLNIKRKIKLRDEVQFSIIHEIINAFFDENFSKKTKEVDLSSRISDAEGKLLLSTETKKELLTVQEYAKKVGLAVETVRGYINQNRIENARKDENGRWLIPANAKIKDWDRRKGRNMPKRGSHPFNRRKNLLSAEDVKEFILQRHLFTEKIASYIHTAGEMDYYVKNSYHEVEWDGRSGLIIDINPNYISLKDGISNRERILNGKAPVVPDRDKEEYEFHIHHVGQHSTSPFAIIPQYDHNSKEYSKFFHARTPAENLHTPEFEIQKIAFWKNYLEMYDKHGCFEKILYLNPRRERGKRND